MEMLGQGLSPTDVGRILGIPRSTIRYWAEIGIPGGLQTGRRRGSTPCPICDGEWELNPANYAYLLGLYLGDGCISATPRTFKLRIFMDAAYPRIVKECALVMEAVVPGKRAHISARKDARCIVVATYWNHWPCLFPQHGHGKKHERTIELVDWQQRIVDQAPEQLVKGLIESDGCRIIANDRGVASTRYHFSNLSDDIKRIYCSALDRLEIPWTRPCAKQVAVYRKTAVARLDEFVGPKS